MIQQRRNSRRFVLSELRTFSGGGGVAAAAFAGEEAEPADVDDDPSRADSDDADDGFCIQLEPMAAPSPRPKMTLADLSSLQHQHDDGPPPSNHEIAQWKSIKNLKSGIT
ncbi:acetyl-CoA carboxylase isoform X1 [Aphis craccivora]|uniref:Acetyl-CoA carboxylase isoform X1 n=1 Tax=Aphis craccivora TaxID=307492 RepID=A0A6G0ZHV4_APHCR|nr:acetyl-CoA carboxylase isoform X1 [Aphis craccivora]